MAYIGSRPADKALQTSDIEDSAITSAKIADGTIASGDVADGGKTSSATKTDTGVSTGSNTPNFLVALHANQNKVLVLILILKYNLLEKFLIQVAIYDNSTNYRFTVGSGNTGKYLLYAQVNI